MSPFFISTPIYYVNARPHLGHAYTTILADSIKRFHQLLAEETFLLTGTDEHGDKIVQAAEEHKVEPQEFVDKISLQFKNLWPHLGVEPDYFIRTTYGHHIEKVQKFLQTVYDQGDIYFGEYGGYYCFGCECFYTEKELVDGLCPDHKKPPQYIKEENYFFRMANYQDWLQEHIQRHPEFIQPEQYRKEVLAMLREPLDDLCISRPKTRLTWGIELPFDTRFVTYVWFDALINYISGLDWPFGENFHKFWPSAHHVVAKDIIKPHAIFWPTMLKAAGLPPYKGLRVHGYWKVDETKMSKSLGNVVEPLDMRQKYGLDAFRYFLLREMHFGHDGNFSESGLVSRFNADLANDLGNLFNRTLAMVHKYFQGRVPEQGALEDQDQEIIELAQDSLAGYLEGFKNFQTAQALEALWSFIRGLNKYIDQSAPWSLFKNKDWQRLTTVMAVVLAGMRKIALALWPVMPDAGSKMCNQLGLDFKRQEVDLRKEIKEWIPLLPNTELAKKSNLFPRQEAIKKEDLGLKKNPQTKKNNQKKSNDFIEFNDFQKLDLRIGTVLKAEPVPKTDNLLSLQIDIGDQANRQIVAGLAQSYSPEEIQGQQVVVLSNLKPRKLKGFLSEGMVLAVQDKDGLKLIGPTDKVQAGSQVS